MGHEERSTAVMLGPLAADVAGREVRTRLDHARLRVRDTTLWPPPAEITDRWLGWLDSVARAEGHLRVIQPLVADVLARGIDDVVLVGMGGSSLFPMVLDDVWGRAPGHPRLHVLDSTDPAAVARIEARVDWARTLVVVASKSGTTVETLAHLDRLAHVLKEALDGAATDRIVAVTDAGGPLERRARTDGFLAVVHGDEDVGGRYSALSPFGLLPAALIGADVDGMLLRAREAAAAWVVDPWSGGGPAAIAALLAAGVATGRDVLHLLVDTDAGVLGDWIEQLVAESSGKDGTGVLPVVTRSVDDVVVPERAVVIAIGAVDGLERLSGRGIPTLVVPWPGRTGLMAEALRWMQAVPLLCAQLAVDPFDQPDVATAKAATAAALESGAEPPGPVPLAAIEPELRDAGAIVLVAFVEPEGPTAAGLPAQARRLAERLGVPVTTGVGPRYLHSTGQLHKGGRPDIALLAIVGDDPVDVAIPGRPYGFARLKRAQAAGDLAALHAAGRVAHRIRVDDSGLGG